MKNDRPKILYVEDDLHLSYVTKENLELKGYDITICKDGKEAIDTFHNSTFDLCILDIMLPEVDGFTVAKKIREFNEHIPIIFLSAKSMKEDKIEGLSIGGDDYMTKPYSIEELILKLEIFLKRNRISRKDNVFQHKYNIGMYTFDHKNLSLSYNKESKRLTSREADLLLFLIKNQNKVMKKEEILSEVWDNDSYFNSRSLDVFISKLRKYLKDDPDVNINNIHGIGFILSISPPT